MSDNDRRSSHVHGSEPEPLRADFTSDYSKAGLAASVSVPAPVVPVPLHGGRYQVLEEIDRGGMGVIWSATDVTLGREVAVKVLQDKFDPDSGTARRFADEARITAQLQHPAIPPVHDYGKLDDGRPFLAMKLIKGRTLEELLRQRADPVAERGRFLAIFEQVCQAVAYAHAHNVIHRDLKPGNIMVGSFGEVQVMDWGLAKVLSDRPVAATTDVEPAETVAGTLIRGSDTDRSSSDSYTQAGSILGTLAYMPPEQAAGEIGKIDQRSDVFGLGAILTVILTGVPPYVGADAEAVRVLAIRGDLSACLTRLDGCGAEPELVALCKRCLAFAPGDRPRHAGAVAEEVAVLRTAAEERARAAEKERAAAEVKAAEQRKRRRWQAAVAAAGVLILALLGVGAWWLDHQAGERERERAVAAERDRQEAVAALARAEQVLAAGDLAAADLALDLAENRIRPENPADLIASLSVAKRDRDFVRDLRDIDDLSWAPGDVSMPDPPSMARKYAAAFSRYGLDVAGADPERAAEAVRTSHVSAALTAALSEWFSADPKGPHLRELLDRLDPNPERTAIRDAFQANDESRVRALVKALDGSKVPAWFAASVGLHSMVPQEEGVRLMAAAWRAHPSDYALAFRSSLRLWGTGEKWLGDMLTWARVAVALRPDSPFAHNQLGHTLRARHEWDEAEASIRRAIELGKKYPRYAGAQVNLGNLLLEKGDLDGAEANYRAALAIDPDAGATYFNMWLVYDRRGEMVEAEKWCRKAVAADPKSALYRRNLDAAVRKSAQLARLEEIVAGRDKPASPAESIEFAILAARLRRYALGASFYAAAFAADPTLADPLKYPHRLWAAADSLRVAAGQDRQLTAPGVEEWSHFTGLALKWLRADLAAWTARAKQPRSGQEVRDQLTGWKNDTGLASIRHPAWLAAMAAPDRAAWEAFWREVDAVIGSLALSAGTSSAKPP